MAYKKLTAKTVYRSRREFGLDDDSCVIYHAVTKEPVFSCHASAIPLIKEAGKLLPFSDLLKVIAPGA